MFNRRVAQALDVCHEFCLGWLANHLKTRERFALYFVFTADESNLFWVIKQGVPAKREFFFWECFRHRFCG